MTKIHLSRGKMEEIFKICFKCGAEKPLSQYYKHPKMSDGHLNKCKDCTKTDVKLHREDNLERIKEYDRNRPNKKEKDAKWATVLKEKMLSDATYKENVYACRKNWGKRNPLKRKAQAAAANAIKNGKLESKYSCEHCGESGVKLQKHHWSYLEEYWLDVIWLCPSCHGKEHRRLNALGRDPDRNLNTSEEINND